MHRFYFFFYFLIFRINVVTQTKHSSMIENERRWACVRKNPSKDNKDGDDAAHVFSARTRYYTFERDNHF